MRIRKKKRNFRKRNTQVVIATIAAETPFGNRTRAADDRSTLRQSRRIAV
jgi:hypothetical protein